MRGSSARATSRRARSRATSGATTVGGVLAVARMVGIRLHGHGRHRRRASRLPDAARRVRRPRRARLVSGSRHVLGREVAPRHPGDDGAPRDARDPGARLPHGHAAALLRRRAADRRSRSASTTSRPPRGSRRRTGSSAPAGSCSTNPPPESIDVGDLIEEAVAEAARQGVSGQAVTPFVLARLHERSGGRTREVNRTLAVANARLAGDVSVAFAAL